MAPGENNKTAAMDLITVQDEDSTEKNISLGDEDSECGDEPEETFGERLWGLTEMFPESLRNVTYTVTCKTSAGLKSFYGLSRNVVWIFVSSSVILFAPLIFEVERAQMEEMQKTQQKQMLLGPNTALVGSSGQGGVPMPPMHRN